MWKRKNEPHYKAFDSLYQKSTLQTQTIAVFLLDVSFVSFCVKNQAGCCEQHVLRCSGLGYLLTRYQPRLRVLSCLFGESAESPSGKIPRTEDDQHGKF